MKKVLMDARTFRSTLDRLGSEIVDRVSGLEGRLALVGVRTRGVPLARRLADRIEKTTGSRPALGILDITLYRDDLTAVASQPILRKTELPFPVDDTWIVLVDDVLYSGRTVRAAITNLVDFGRPRKIELLVMVDRGWRELPIQADYVGANVTTTRDQMVNVLVAEEDGIDQVDLVDKADAT